MEQAPPPRGGASAVGMAGRVPQPLKRQCLSRLVCHVLGLELEGRTCSNLNEGRAGLIGQ